MLWASDVLTFPYQQKALSISLAFHISPIKVCHFLAILSELFGTLDEIRATPLPKVAIGAQMMCTELVHVNKKPLEKILIPMAQSFRFYWISSTPIRLVCGPWT